MQSPKLFLHSCLSELSAALLSLHLEVQLATESVLSMKGSAPRGLLYLASTASQIELPAEGGRWDRYPQLDWRLRKWSSRWEQALTSDSLVHKSCLTGRTGLPSIWKGSPFITLVSIGFEVYWKSSFVSPLSKLVWTVRLSAFLHLCLTPSWPLFTSHLLKKEA